MGAARAGIREGDLLGSVGLWRAVLERARADVPVVAAAWLLLLCATTMLAATILYAQTVAIGGLRQAVRAADPATRSVDVRLSVGVAQLASIDALVRPQVEAALRSVNGSVARIARSDPLTAASSDAATTRNLVIAADLEALDDHARLTAGHWPTAGRNPIEATLSTAAAGALGLAVGDSVSLVDIRDTAARSQLTVVGLWQPNDPDDPYWLGNRLELEGSEPGAGFTTRGPFVVPAADLLGRGITRDVAAEWRGVVPIDALTVDAAGRLGDDVDGLRARLPAVLPRLVPPVVSTGLPGLLSSTRQAIAVSWASIVLLTLQFSVLAAYAVLLVAGMLLERRRVETALLRSRGASTGHLAAMALAEAVALAVPSVLAAPILALGAVRLIAALGPGGVSTVPVDPAFVAVPAAAALAAGLGCVLALTLPTVVSGAGPSGIRAALGRPFGRTLAQRAGLDLALVIVAAIALWQLELYGAPLTRNAKGTLGADPLLVAAPAIALVAGGLVAIRVLPRLAEIGERAFGRTAGLVASLGSRQLARRPLHYTRSALLLVLAVALGTFAAAYHATWSRSQVDQAIYRAAADVRIVANDYPTLPAWGTASVVAATPGVTAAMPVTRETVDLGRTVRGADLLALDAGRVQTLAAVDPTPGSAVGPGLAQLAEARPIGGIAMPGDPRRLRIQLDTSLGIVDSQGTTGVPDFRTTKGIDLVVVVSDVNGRLARIAIGSAYLAASGQEISAPLVAPSGRGGARPAVSPPLRLEAIEIGVDPPPFQPTSGAVDLRGVSVSGDEAGGAWTDVPLDPGSPDWRWLEVKQSGNDAYTPPAGAPGRIEVGDPNRPLYVSTDEPAPVYRLWDAAGTGQPVGAIGSKRFLAQAGLDVGDSVTVDDSGRPLPLRIVAATDLFAPLDPAVPFLVVDGPTLDLDRFSSFGYPSVVSEWWLRVAPDQAAAVGDSLSLPPFAAKAVVAREAVERSLATDPVSLGVIGALALGSIAALVFAAIGFLANATVGTAERAGELAVLRALGVSGRQLVGWLAVESVVLLVVGLVAGAGLGVLLALLVLPFASLTPTGVPPVPPPVVVVPFGAIVPIYGLAVVLLVVAVAIAGRQVPPLHAGAALRARTE